MNKIAFLFLMVVAAFVSPILAQDTPAVDEKCIREGWVTDKNPKGLSVRAKPSVTSDSVGKIPFANDDDDNMVTVEIIGYRNGWLRISRAITISDSVVFQGDGWIPANKVTANVQTPTGKPAPFYALPKLTSKRIGTIPADKFIDIIGYDCFGLKIRYKGKTGWLPAKHICGNPVTTCA